MISLATNEKGFGVDLVAGDLFLLGRLFGEHRDNHRAQRLCCLRCAKWAIALMDCR